MFPDAPVTPVQVAMELPPAEPAEAEPHPDLFLGWPPALVPEPLPVYLLEGEEPSGPFPQPDVIARLRNGSLAPELYAWHGGLDDWRRLEELFPEAVPVCRLASFGVRFAAGCIDLGVILAIYVALMIVLPPFREWIEASSLSRRGLVVANLALSAAVCLYFLLFLGPPGKGRTPGYRFLRIRLLDQATHRTLGWPQALLWCAGSLAMIVGWPLYWLDGTRRMLHNRVSRTIVVNDLS
jgi:uncharacterized RDD family membrane protein YckC